MQNCELGFDVRACSPPFVDMPEGHSCCSLKERTWALGHADKSAPSPAPETMDKSVPRRLTKVTLQALDWLIARTGRAEVKPEHQQTGRCGEEAAYFHLRQLGYVVVASNLRSPRRRGEIDMA